MRKSLVVFVILGGSTVVSSLQQATCCLGIRSPTTPQIAPFLLAATKNDGVDDAAAEEYLSELWMELKRTERDVVVQENIKGISEGDMTKHLVEEMLDTALEHVKTKERLEAKHAKKAHEALEKAVQEEKVLHEFVEEEQLHDVPMDGFIRERLEAAEETEQRAMKEEDESVRTFEELRNSESTIKATLEALKRLEP